MALLLKYGIFLLCWLAAVHEEIYRICVKQSGGDPIVDSHLFFGKAEYLVSPLPICSQPSVCGAAEKTGSTVESSCFATGLNFACESCTGNAVQAA